MEIQTRNALGTGQRDGQLQLCVPLVAIDGPSYRMRAHQQRTEQLRKALHTHGGAS